MYVGITRRLTLTPASSNSPRSAARCHGTLKCSGTPATRRGCYHEQENAEHNYSCGPLKNKMQKANINFTNNNNFQLSRPQNFFPNLPNTKTFSPQLEPPARTPTRSPINPSHIMGSGTSGQRGRGWRGIQDPDGRRIVGLKRDGMVDAGRADL